MRTTIDVQDIDTVRIVHFPPTDSRTGEFWTVNILDDAGNRVALFINPNDLIAKLERAVDVWQDATQ
jgi:hypothetical protein